MTDDNARAARSITTVDVVRVSVASNSTSPDEQLEIEERLEYLGHM